jgi:dipeptidyl aminopeptidase/acylaminoacyl peptidase
MKRKINRCLMIILATLVAGVTMLNVLAYNHARDMMQFTLNATPTGRPEELPFWTTVQTLLRGVKIPRPSHERSPWILAPGCRALSINGPDNITLATWYCDQGKGTPLVTLFHGYAADKTSLMREAKILIDLDLSVLLVDFRGSGGSSESYTTAGVREGDDVATVVRYTKENLSQAHTSTILFGHSMGAVAILRAVHEHSVAPDAVILEAVFDTMLNTVRNRFAALGVPSFPSAELLVFWGGWQADFCGFSHNPVDYARSVHSPALFMHGVSDSRATLAQSLRVFEAVAGPKEFIEFEAIGHEALASKYPQEWQAAVAEFISKAHNKNAQGKISPPEF